MIKLKGFNNVSGNVEIDIVEMRQREGFRVSVWKPMNDLIAQANCNDMFKVSEFLGDFMLRLQIRDQVLDLIPLTRNKRPEAIRKFFIRCEVE